MPAAETSPHPAVRGAATVGIYAWVALALVLLTGLMLSAVLGGTFGFLAGVLQFVLAHQPTLLAFCEASGSDPAAVTAALRALPFGDDRFEAST